MWLIQTLSLTSFKTEIKVLHDPDESTYDVTIEDVTIKFCREKNGK